MQAGKNHSHREGVLFNPIVLVVLGLAIVLACTPVVSSFENKFTIRTQKVEFPEEGKFSATVVFTNELGREVRIINVGCGFPGFVLEQRMDGEWKTVGGPVCIALAVPPTPLGHGETLTATVSMYVESALKGVFRLQFDIREKEMTTQLPPAYLVSDQFTLE